MPDETGAPDTADLRRVLREIQRRGAIGRLDLGEAIAHADRYVDALPDQVTEAIDLGSGGGLPGLVIATRCRHLRLRLVERRAKRADLLRFGVRALGLGDRVQVVEGDVVSLLKTGELASADVVTARSFAPLPHVLEIAGGLLRGRGCCLVSAPPAPESPPLVDGWTSDALPGVWVFHVEPH